MSQDLYFLKCFTCSNTVITFENQFITIDIERSLDNYYTLTKYMPCVPDLVNFLSVHNIQDGGLSTTKYILVQSLCDTKIKFIKVQIFWEGLQNLKKSSN